MKKFKSVSRLLLASVLVAALTIGGTATALPTNGKAEIIIQPASGVTSFELVKKIEPNKQITKVSNALAISSIVKHLDLNLDRFRFVKQPKATDYFTKVKNDAWYSNAFVIAQLNGLKLPKEINPSSIVTREQFSSWLYQALITTGDYSWIELYIEVKDNTSIKAEYRDSIQKLLIAGIAKLDDKKQFNPTKNITYSEVLSMLQLTKQFIEKQSTTIPTPAPLDVTLSTEKVTDEVKKVLLTAEVGHPGYGLEISNIAFKGNKAYISYRLLQPDPDKMYPQVITKVTATTYIPASYEAVISSESAKTK